MLAKSIESDWDSLVAVTGMTVWPRASIPAVCGTGCTRRNLYGRA